MAYMLRDRDKPAPMTLNITFINRYLEEKEHPWTQVIHAYKLSGSTMQAQCKRHMIHRPVKEVVSISWSTITRGSKNPRKRSKACA